MSEDHEPLGSGTILGSLLENERLAEVLALGGAGNPEKALRDRGLGKRDRMRLDNPMQGSQGVVRPPIHGLRTHRRAVRTP